MKALFTLILVVAIVSVGCQPSSREEGAAMSPHVQRLENAPVNVNEWAAASHMLIRAGELIQERGWQQGSTVPTSRECIATALEHAFREKDYTIVDFNYAREALARNLNIERDPSPLANDPIAIPYWGRSLMEWNDEKGRTEEDVIRVLQAAAITATQFQQEAIQQAQAAVALSVSVQQ